MHNWINLTQLENITAWHHESGRSILLVNKWCSSLCLVKLLFFQQLFSAGCDITMWNHSGDIFSSLWFIVCCAKWEATHSVLDLCCSVTMPTGSGHIRTVESNSSLPDKIKYTSNPSLDQLRSQLSSKSEWSVITERTHTHLLYAMPLFVCSQMILYIRDHM